MRTVATVMSIQQGLPPAACYFFIAAKQSSEVGDI